MILWQCGQTWVAFVRRDRRNTGADAGVGVAEGGDVGFFVAVKFRDEQARLVVQAVVEGDLRSSGKVQPVGAAGDDQHGAILSFADHEVERAVAVPIGRPH
jgi:hypothetical protein